MWFYLLVGKEIIPMITGQKGKGPLRTFFLLRSLYYKKGSASMNENENRCGIPQHVLESFARAIYPSMIEFFNSPEGIKEYEEWKESQNRATK